MTSIVVFFALTYAITWICWLPVVRAAQITPALYALWLLGVFTPSIVAILLTAREGAGRVRDLLARVVRFDVAARWYVFAVGYMAGVKLTVPRQRAAWPNQENLERRYQEFRTAS